MKGLKFEPKKSGTERGFILCNPEAGRMDELKTGTDGEGVMFFEEYTHPLKSGNGCVH